ncbi:hypothetical protein P8C59_001442 [Phyllachora maydis]|uniref:Uncharacterized protein n=1 Tax=Phyllachora maydis TaxID=1825666 RepID=A0AAD9HY68_9PEZI|nr:hypothetical protein P8C59_001442 [Phyllachora maydis]
MRPSKAHPEHRQQRKQIEKANLGFGWGPVLALSLVGTIMALDVEQGVRKYEARKDRGGDGAREDGDGGGARDRDRDRNRSGGRDGRRERSRGRWYGDDGDGSRSRRSVDGGVGYGPRSWGGERHDDRRDRYDALPPPKRYRSRSQF